MTVTGQETVQDIETVSGTGLYSVVTNDVNLSFSSLVAYYPSSFLLSLSHPPIFFLSVLISSDPPLLLSTTFLLPHICLSLSINICTYVFISVLPFVSLNPSSAPCFSLCLFLSLSLSQMCRQYISHSDSLPSVPFHFSNNTPHYTTPHHVQEFVVINGIVASPFAENHFVANIFYNLHRAMYATFPYVLQCNSVKQSNEVRGRCE
jgi:hypothetical protein